MPAQYLNIEAKHRQFLGNLASLLDFTVSEGDEVDANRVLTNPGVSLYCLDDATQRAIFVELPPEIDLAPAPFVYQTQYEQAIRLIAMPYDIFRALAHTLPEAKRLILMFSCGRSGSTLLSHILNAVDGVLSLAEADVSCQFIHLRPTDGSRDAELSELLDDTVRTLFKPNAFKTPAIYGLKFRSEATQLIDLYHKSFPQAKTLYIYRDAISYVASVNRLLRKAQIPEMTPRDEYVASTTQRSGYDFTTLVSYLDPDATQVSMTQQITLNWLSNLELYLAQIARGIPVLAVRYADLNDRREPTLRAIFDYCGLPSAQIAQALKAFEQDSQAGTFLEREKPGEGNAYRLTDEQISEITTILARHPVINVSDFVVPGTLSL